MNETETNLKEIYNREPLFVEDILHSYYFKTKCLTEAEERWLRDASAFVLKG